MTQPQTAELPLRDRMAQAVASPAVSVVVIDVKRLDVLVPLAVAASGIGAIHETLELLTGELGRRRESLSRGDQPHPLVLFIGEAGVLTRRLAPTGLTGVRQTGAFREPRPQSGHWRRSLSWAGRRAST